MELLVEYLAHIDANWIGTTQELRASIAQAWDMLMPSTHHDYITGTAVQYVYENEQIRGSWSVTMAMERAQQAQADLLDAIGGGLTQSTSQGLNVACLNNLGFARTNALVTMPAPQLGSGSITSATTDDQNFAAVQYSEDQSELMFFGSAPALGYASVQLLTQTPPNVTPPTLNLVSNNNGTITLPNGSGQFVCPDAAYTTGNLGKGWNELDLVPFRLRASAGNSAPAPDTAAPRFPDRSSACWSYESEPRWRRENPPSRRYHRKSFRNIRTSYRRTRYYSSYPGLQPPRLARPATHRR